MKSITFGEQLRSLREAMGHTLRSLEEITGISNASLSHYEVRPQAFRRMSFEHAIKLSRALRWPIEKMALYLDASE